jgi:hypothetical protein|tara:strand:- start:1192 stop:1497 length:306 start_codon:yes stop_codon:yes gene_type:complete
MTTTTATQYTASHVFPAMIVARESIKDARLSPTIASRAHPSARASHTRAVSTAHQKITPRRHRIDPCMHIERARDFLARDFLARGFDDDRDSTCRRNDRAR